MNEIVKYHNDFNKINLPSFTEQEQNMLFGIIAKMRTNPISENIKLTRQELLSFSTENLTNKALGDLLLTLRDKFFKADFTILIEDVGKERIGKEIVNIFQSFKLWYPKNDIRYNHLQSLELQVNPRFTYLINELTANFTRFELAEFIAISGKYTKTLYRLLKQFRNTGYRKFEWDEFLRIMNIPQNYQMRDIEKRILKPAIKELIKERTLFDIKRIPFKNLIYTKLKGKGRGKGGNVIGIEFKFDPEEINKQEVMIQELQKENKLLEQQCQNINRVNMDLMKNLDIREEFGQYLDISFYNDSGEVIRIKDVWKDFSKIYVRFENRENNKSYIVEFNNKNHIDNYLNKFTRI